MLLHSLFLLLSRRSPVIQSFLLAGNGPGLRLLASEVLSCTCVCVCVCVCVCLDVSGCTGSGLSFKPCHSLAPLLMKWWGQLCVCVCVCTRISVFWCCLKLCVAILYTLRGTTTQRYRKRECVCVCGCVCESADAGERETRPAPSRVRPCAHKCFSEPQSTFTCFCVSVSLCVCVCVLVWWSLIAVVCFFFHRPVQVCQRDAEEQIHTYARAHSYTEGGWQKGRRMRVADRDRMSHKGTNTVRGSEMVHCQVCVCECVCPQGQEEGPVSISLSFFNWSLYRVAVCFYRSAFVALWTLLQPRGTIAHRRDHTLPSWAFSCARVCSESQSLRLHRLSL